jgi:hypothetical protein
MRNDVVTFHRRLLRHRLQDSGRPQGLMAPTAAAPAVPAWSLPLHPVLQVGHRPRTSIRLASINITSRRVADRLPVCLFVFLSGSGAVRSSVSAITAIVADEVGPDHTKWLMERNSAFEDFRASYKKNQVRSSSNHSLSSFLPPCTSEHCTVG